MWWASESNLEETALPVLSMVDMVDERVLVMSVRDGMLVVWTNDSARRRFGFPRRVVEFVVRKRRRRSEMHLRKVFIVNGRRRGGW